MSKILRFKIFKEQYLHGGSLPTFTYTNGINYGNRGNNVGDNVFGDKGDKTFNKRGKMGNIENSLVYSNIEDKYYSITEIDKLIHIYNSQNTKHDLTLRYDTETLDFLIKNIS